MRSKIEGKTYVVLGASSGIGKGVAEDLGKYKANVVLAARRTELLEHSAETITSLGGNALAVTTDISKPDEAERLAGLAIAKYGKIDVWINVAGVGAIGEAWEIPLQDQARLIDVNLKGFVYGSISAIKQFRKQGSGVLINIASIDSEVPNAYQASYSASKAAIRSYSLALGQELRLDGHKNIKVVVIEPWAIDTPFWQHSANYTGKFPKFALMDGPQKVVNAIIRKSVKPRKIVPVGGKAKIASFTANLFPRFMERISANISHNYKMQMPPEAPDSAGNLYQPMTEGTSIDGGVRKIIEETKAKTPGPKRNSP